MDFPDEINNISGGVAYDNVAYEHSSGDITFLSGISTAAPRSDPVSDPEPDYNLATSTQEENLYDTLDEPPEYDSSPQYVTPNFHENPPPTYEQSRRTAGRDRGHLGAL